MSELRTFVTIHLGKIYFHTGQLSRIYWVLTVPEKFLDQTGT